MQRGQGERLVGAGRDPAGASDATPRSGLLARPHAIWGVLNVTPDSFSDGGRFLDVERAVAQGLRLAAEGADVIDVGGESTRPRGAAYGAGAEPVSVEEELRRVLPVITRLAEARICVSVDTTKGEVARAALEAGARVVNDVTAGRDARLLEQVAARGADLVLMHNRGRGEVEPPNTDYTSLVDEVLRELDAAVRRAVEAGVSESRLWIDPGLGFAKTPAQSLRLLAALPRFVATGYPVLVGPSRKAFVAAAAPDPDGTLPGPDAREGGTAGAVALAGFLGAEAVRVHDVRETRQAFLVGRATRYSSTEVGR